MKTWKLSILRILKPGKLSFEPGRRQSQSDFGSNMHDWSYYNRLFRAFWTSEKRKLYTSQLKALLTFDQLLNLTIFSWVSGSNRHSLVVSLLWKENITIWSRWQNVMLFLHWKNSRLPTFFGFKSGFTFSAFLFLNRGKSRSFPAFQLFFTTI